MIKDLLSGDGTSTARSSGIPQKEKDKNQPFPRLCVLAQWLSSTQQFFNSLQRLTYRNASATTWHGVRLTAPISMQHEQYSRRF